MKVKGDVDMAGFEDGGYVVRYHKYNGCYPGYVAYEVYATKAEALKGIKELNGFIYEIMEYPGKCKPGRRITLAELEAPENE